MFACVCKTLWEEKIEIRRKRNLQVKTKANKRREAEMPKAAQKTVSEELMERI